MIKLPILLPHAENVGRDVGAFSERVATEEADAIEATLAKLKGRSFGSLSVPEYDDGGGGEVASMDDVGELTEDAEEEALRCATIRVTFPRTPSTAFKKLVDPAAKALDPTVRAEEPAARALLRVSRDGPS